MLTNEFGEARDKLSVDELDIIALDDGIHHGECLCSHLRR